MGIINREKEITDKGLGLISRSWKRHENYLQAIHMKFRE